MSQESKQEPLIYSDWQALLGFFEEDEALLTIQGQGVKLVTPIEEWLVKIRKGRETVSKISERLKLKPEIHELGEDHEKRILNLQSEPTYKEHLVGMKSGKFALIELAKLHIFHPSLNLEYINSMNNIPMPNDLSNTIKFCLPTKEETQKSPILTSFNPNNNTFFAVAQNLDFRITGNIQGEDPITHRQFFGFLYSLGLPQISVVEYKGIYIIKNGSHRAFALLNNGHKFLPCLLLSTDSYQATGGLQPGVFPNEVILSEKSPLLSDFLTSAALTIPRRRVRIVISIHAESHIVPI